MNLDRATLCLATAAILAALASDSALFRIVMAMGWLFLGIAYFVVGVVRS